MNKDSEDEVPTMVRRPLPRGRARKRAIAVNDQESGILAPLVDSALKHSYTTC